jgi:hypothetical protein
MILCLNLRHSSCVRIKHSTTPSTFSTIRSGKRNVYLIVDVFHQKMSSQPKEDAFSPVMIVKSTHDACKGCRSCFRSVTHTIAINRILTSVFSTLPMLCMVALLIYFERFWSVIYIQNQTYYIQQWKPILLSPLYFVSTITFIAWILSIVAIKCELQNLLGFCSFVYAAIAYWALINILILFFTAWVYLPIAIIGLVFVWSIIPTLLWLFTSAVMDAHRIQINEAIRTRTPPLATAPARETYVEAI